MQLNKWLNYSMVLGSLAFAFAASPTHAGEITDLDLHVEGGTSGGGGDQLEPKFGAIRADILEWIQKGGAKGLTLRGKMAHADYESRMISLLKEGAVTVTFVTLAEELASSDPELKVSIDGKRKTCRGFEARLNGRKNILCNTERFGMATDEDRYVVVHHEYAGLAGIERNTGPDSDYFVSNQLTKSLVYATTAKLAVNPVYSAADMRVGDCQYDECDLFNLIGQYERIQGKTPDLSDRLAIHFDSIEKKLTTLWSGGYLRTYGIDSDIERFLPCTGGVGNSGFFDDCKRQYNYYTLVAHSHVIDLITKIRIREFAGGIIPLPSSDVSYLLHRLQPDHGNLRVTTYSSSDLTHGKFERKSSDLYRRVGD